MQERRSGVDWFPSPDQALVATVFSPVGGVGKSNLALNLAASLARGAEGTEDENGEGGIQVLLLDGNWVSPSIGLMVSGDSEPNFFQFADALGRGENSVDDWILTRDDIPHLHILPAPEVLDKRRKNLSSAKLEQAFEVLEKTYDFIIIDAGSDLNRHEQAFWFQNSHEVFFLTSYDVHGIYLTLHALRFAIEKSAWREKENVTLLFRSSTWKPDFSIQELIEATVPWLRPEQTLLLPDFSPDISSAGLEGSFYFLQDEEYSGIIQLLESRLFRYITTQERI